jgi:hypothetical protein|tara:strand:+ start:453 stop:863 length:411 start_codon:yes stop_codon:yes gene_type:complete
MKIFLTLTIIFFIIGCSSNNNVDTTEKNNLTPAPSASASDSDDTMLTSLREELQVRCVLDATVLTVTCATHQTIANSSIEWINVESGITGNELEFTFIIEDYSPQVTVVLKECVDNNCEEIKKKIPIKHLQHLFQK